MSLNSYCIINNAIYSFFYEHTVAIPDDINLLNLLIIYQFSVSIGNFCKNYKNSTEAILKIFLNKVYIKLGEKKVEFENEKDHPTNPLKENPLN
jgi:hypothetical protein